VRLRDEDEFLIVACDGLWDVVTDQAAVEFVRGINNAQEMADFLVAKALELGTTDNVTVVCVRLRPAV
jgi:protein phosphatase PTC1